MFTVVIPVLYLTEYSRCALQYISQKAISHTNVKFICSCTFDVETEVREIFKNCPNVLIVVTKAKTSNFLRFNALQYVKTNYVYYQDCDDIVYYDIISKYIDVCTGSNVICFNIKKIIFDEFGKICHQGSLYSTKEGIIKNIQNLPTNIVNKLVPISCLKGIHFYNIPFTQDLSLSFQLFDVSEHYFVNEDVYVYQNNPKSTSGIKKTQYASLLRVAAMERKLLRLSKYEYNKAYIQYRYEIILNSRFAYLRHRYYPHISVRMFNVFYWGLRGVLRYIYYYFVAIYKCIRF